MINKVNNYTDYTNLLSSRPLFIEGDINSASRKLNLSNYLMLKIFKYVVDPSYVYTNRGR